MFTDIIEIFSRELESITTIKLHSIIVIGSVNSQFYELLSAQLIGKIEEIYIPDKHMSYIPQGIYASPYASHLTPIEVVNTVSTATAAYLHDSIFSNDLDENSKYIQSCMCVLSSLNICLTTNAQDKPTIATMDILNGLPFARRKISDERYLWSFTNPLTQGGGGII